MKHLLTLNCKIEDPYHNGRTCFKPRLLHNYDLYHIMKDMDSFLFCSEGIWYFKSK